MAKPVLFLSFANQADNPLPQLSVEDRIVYETLSQSPQAEDFTIHRDEFATAESMTTMLRTFDNKLSLFHYAGHAAEAQLFLADKPVQGDGLIQLLALQPHLHLVFLNGCHTSGFIKQLQKAGVPAIIATSRAVEDPVAVELAKEFYNCLGKGFTIGKAFAFAKGALEQNGIAQPGAIAVRGIRLPSESKAEFPWGLYYLDEKALEWRLADAIDDLSPVPSAFWSRLAILVLVVFGLFTWGNIHLGYENLALYLAIGPFALIAITTTFLKLFGKHYPRIMTQVGNPLFAILNFLLKPAVIFGLLIIVVGLFAAFTSVRVDHSNRDSLVAAIRTSDNRTVHQWKINPNNSDQTRILALSNPIGRHHVLNIDGYQERKTEYGLLGSMRISLEGLQTNPVVLVRIPFRLISLHKQLSLKILRNGNPYLDDTPFGSSYAIQLNNKTDSIPDSIRNGWRAALTGIPQGAIEKAVGFWKLREYPDVNALHEGDTLTLFLKQGDSLRVTKEFIFKAQNFTDVLLQ